MAYIGQQVSLPLGQLGLVTDDAETLIPANALIEANNVRLDERRIVKAPGSSKFNTSALDAGIVALHDYFPTPSLQRLIAVTSNGKLWRDTGNGTFTAGVPIKTGLGSPTTDTVMVEGGAEAPGNNKKLFIFTGTSQVQVIDGDASVANNITTPTADWASAFPKFGIVHRDRLWAFGNSNAPHRIYASSASDHEDFGTPITFEVFPGEGDGIVSAFSYKGRLFLFKQPRGVYILDDSQDFTNNFSNTTIRKLDDSFGAASPHSVVQVLDDLLAGSFTNSITSLKAVEAFGDVRSGDVLANAKIEDFVRARFAIAGREAMQAIYYEEKKIAMFTYQGQGFATQNRILEMDVNQAPARFAVNTKDQPTVLTLRRDGDGIKKPIYGNDDGFVFLMEDANRNVDGVAYTGEFETPNMDLSFVNQSLAGQRKLFDFITIVFESTGSFNFSIDIFVDDTQTQTITVAQQGSVGLGTFVLDQDQLDGTTVQRVRRRLRGSGDRIRFKFSNSGLNETFKIEQIILGFRLSDEGVE